MIDSSSSGRPHAVDVVADVCAHRRCRRRTAGRHGASRASTPSVHTLVRPQSPRSLSLFLVTGLASTMAGHAGRAHLRRHAPLSRAAPRSRRAHPRPVSLRGAEWKASGGYPLAGGAACARNRPGRAVVGRAGLGGAARPGHLARGALSPRGRARVPLARARERRRAAWLPRRSRRPPAWGGPRAGRRPGSVHAAPTGQERGRVGGHPARTAGRRGGDGRGARSPTVSRRER